MKTPYCQYQVLRYPLTVTTSLAFGVFSPYLVTKTSKKMWQLKQKCIANRSVGWQAKISQYQLLTYLYDWISIHSSCCTYSLLLILLPCLELVSNKWSVVYANTPCPEKRGHGFFCITLTNVDTVSYFFAWTIPRTHFSKKIENLFLILSHRYVVMM